MMRPGENNLNMNKIIPTVESASFKSALSPEDEQALLKKRDALLRLKGWDKEKNPEMNFVAADNVFFKFRGKAEDLDGIEIEFAPNHIYQFQADLVNMNFENIQGLKLVGLADKNLQLSAWVSFPINLEDNPEIIKKIAANKAKAEGLAEPPVLDNELAIIKAKAMAHGKTLLNKEDLAKIVEEAFYQDDWENFEK